MSPGRVCSWLLLSFMLGLAGCDTIPLHNVVIGPDYQVSNVFRKSPFLPDNLRRVAVLPLSGDESQVEITAGQQTLDPVLRTELLKVRKFESIWVTPESLRQWTGRKIWEAEDRLSTNFFSKLREETGCDAVLFCRVSRFHAYPPLTIGWKLKLIEASQGQTLWAVDEIFDAGEPPVSNSARRYEQHHEKGGPVTDSPMILSSPQRFGHYTAWAVLETLPER
jgi:hypothetical protein